MWIQTGSCFYEKKRRTLKIFPIIPVMHTTKPLTLHICSFNTAIATYSSSVFSYTSIIFNAFISPSMIYISEIKTKQQFTMKMHPVNSIQILTYDEGNMTFYGSEATILTQAMPRLILLPKIHKTYISQHHRSIFALLYIKCLWLKPIGL